MRTFPSVTMHSCRYGGNNLTAVWFTMPPFEGKVTLRLQLDSSGAIVSSINLFSLPAAPPRITAVVSSFFSNDPCAQLIPVITRGKLDWSRSSTCVQDAAALYTWPNYTNSPSAPCFDALALGTLMITGTSFGSGVSPTSVTVGAVSCKVLPHPAFAKGDNDTFEVRFYRVVRVFVARVQRVLLLCLQCSLTDTFSRGPAPLALTIAYTTTNASDFGIVPRAECPCGQYSEVDGRACAQCPLGGICPGASLPAVAQAGYWRTNQSEWISQRFIDPTGTVIPLFVPCPSPSLCLAGQVCAEGSDKWACATCLTGFAKGGVGTPCFKCGGTGDLTSCVASVTVLLSVALTVVLLFLCRLIVVLVIAAAIVGGVAGAVYYLIRRRQKAADANKPKKVDKPKPKPVDRNQDGINVTVVEMGAATFLKILTSFIQTIGSLTSYLPKTPKAPSSSDKSLVPQMISSTGRRQASSHWHFRKPLIYNLIQRVQLCSLILVLQCNRFNVLDSFRLR